MTMETRCQREGDYAILVELSRTALDWTEVFVKVSKAYMSLVMFLYYLA